jgi:hypothetical protein
VLSFVLSFVQRDSTMASNWTIRRSIVTYTEKVEDSSELLKLHLTKNNFIDVNAVSDIMQHLEEKSVPNISAAIERAEASKDAMESLIAILRNQKKRKEAKIRLMEKNETSVMKRLLQQHRLNDLSVRSNAPQWVMPPDQDDVDQMDEHV